MNNYLVVVSGEKVYLHREEHTKYIYVFNASDEADAKKRAMSRMADCGFKHLSLVDIKIDNTYTKGVGFDTFVDTICAVGSVLMPAGSDAKVKEYLALAGEDYVDKPHTTKPHIDFVVME